MNVSNASISDEQSSISIQVYQDIYNEITGKSEKIRRLFTSSHIARFEDFQQLHFRFEQFVKQYDCIVSNCSISISYSNQATERFSSFEKFERTGLNRSHSIEQVEITYDLLLRVPQSKEARPYRVEIGLRSELGIIDSFQKHDVSDAEVRLFHSFARGTARLEITYVDITVARSLESQVVDWYESLKKSKERPFRGFSRKAAPVSGLLVRFSGLLSAGLVLLFLFSDRIDTLSSLYRSALVSMLVIILLNILFMRLSSWVERTVERRRPMSAIVLSTVDEDLLNEQKAQLWLAIKQTAWAISGAIALGLATAYIASMIGI